MKNSGGSSDFSTPEEGQKGEEISMKSGDAVGWLAELILLKRKR
jgi:hypothetical protein